MTKNYTKVMNGKTHFRYILTEPFLLRNGLKNRVKKCYLGLIELEIFLFLPINSFKQSSPNNQSIIYLKEKEKRILLNFSWRKLLSFLYTVDAEMGHLLESHLLKKTARHQNLDCSTPSLEHVWHRLS